MPIQRCESDGMKGWSWGPSGKCYTYEPGNKASEAEAKKKAIAQGLAIGDLHAQSRIIFDSDIPADVVKYWVDQERKVYILGSGIDRPNNKAQKLAKQANIASHKVLFGDVKELMNRYKINLYYTTKFRDDIDGLVVYNHQIDTGFASIEERWVTMKDDRVCPICSDLEALDWVPRGTLPPYRQAHEIIGGPNWKAKNSSCRCYKEVRNVFSSQLSTDTKSRVIDVLMSYIDDNHTNCGCMGKSI